MSTVTVQSSTADGAIVVLTIELASPQSAILTARTYGSSPPATGEKPRKVDAAQLYGVTASADGRTVKCRANVPGSDPTVTCQFLDAPAPAVAISIRGTTFGWGDKDVTYRIEQADLASLVQFVIDAELPDETQFK